jgi:SpoVK/Ycf46/Vps4 family AAA+-type ATPase
MISVDTGAIASGGASYLRRLIDRIEASAPAVVYFDELDKLFPDAGQPADVQQRQVLGLLLTWLQDKVSQTFVMATLNRLDSLPPELTRLGRFDEIFYVGFPQNGERKDILHLHLARFDERYQQGNSPMSEKDWRVIINQTVNFTGAELSTMVEKAARRLFHQGKDIQINLEELLAIRQEIIPLFVRDTDRILRIENIAKGVATPCSSPDSSIYAPPLTTLWGNQEVN